jgi:hypothetical protein
MRGRQGNPGKTRSTTGRCGQLRTGIRQHLFEKHIQDCHHLPPYVPDSVSTADTIWRAVAASTVDGLGHGHREYRIWLIQEKSEAKGERQGISRLPQAGFYQPICGREHHARSGGTQPERGSCFHPHRGITEVKAEETPRIRQEIFLLGPNILNIVLLSRPEFFGPPWRNSPFSGRYIR